MFLDQPSIMVDDEIAPESLQRFLDALMASVRQLQHRWQDR
jgi:hypothetical protein